MRGVVRVLCVICRGEGSSAGIFYLRGGSDLSGDVPDPSASDLLIDRRVNGADAEWGRGGEVFDLFDHSGRDRRAADPLAAGPCGVHAGADAFADQCGFRFGHRPDDREHGASHGAVGVDLVLHADEAHAEMVEFLEGDEEVTHGPGEPVKLPDQDAIELAVARPGHQGLELGAAHLPA